MEYLEITMDQLQNSHSLKRGQAVFQPAKEIVKPFIDILAPHTDDYIIKAKAPNSQAIDVAVDEYGIENVQQQYESYERINIEAVLKPDYQFDLNGNDRYQKVIGMIYALDLQTPIAKVYTGYKRSACLNMCIFGNGSITKRAFNDADFTHIYDVLPTYLDTIVQERDFYTTALREMTEVTYENEELNRLLGVLSRRIVSKDNAGLVNNFVNMLRLIQRPDDVKNIENIYYNQAKRYTKYDIYQALTASVTRKTDMFSAPEMILKSHKLFEAA